MYSRIYIRFNKCVRGTFHISVKSECPQQASGEGGFPGAEVPAKINGHARLQRGGECRAQGHGRRFVLQRKFGCVPGIIQRMENKLHSIGSGKESARDALAALRHEISVWGSELGFDAVRVADVDLSSAEAGLQAWLQAGFHGEMDYMGKHGTKRTRPAELVPNTCRVISARMSYLPDAADALENLRDGSRAYVSRYALGRDYHKVLRARLQQLASRIAASSPHGYRVFVDSAPVMEVELAGRAGLGWRGKHSLLIDRSVGSMFFLGEIYTDLPLAVDAPVQEHCGSCRACLDACPTGAIVAPYRVDARLCISYLTIELRGAIPVPLRKMLGNRVYGCDDCQLVCPWNRFARLSKEGDFAVRNGLDQATLAELFHWSEADFNERMAGSAIYRVGYERWLRNLAVGLGNAQPSASVLAALGSRREDRSELVRDHVVWALSEHMGR